MALRPGNIIMAYDDLTFVLAVGGVLYTFLLIALVLEWWFERRQ